MNNEHYMVTVLCHTHGKFIESSFFEAVKHFYEIHEAELLAIRPATKAALINDYIYQNLQEVLEPMGSFYFIKNKKGRFIGYDNKLLIRIKKLSKVRKPTINRTASARRFNTQGDMKFDDWPDVPKVYLGYVLNSDSGNIDQVAFAYPNEVGVIAWTINVTEQIIQKTLDIDSTIVPITHENDDPGKDKTGHFTPKDPSKKKNNV